MLRPWIDVMRVDLKVWTEQIESGVHTDHEQAKIFSCQFIRESFARLTGLTVLSRRVLRAPLRRQARARPQDHPARQAARLLGRGLPGRHDAVRARGEMGKRMKGGSQPRLCGVLSILTPRCDCPYCVRALHGSVLQSSQGQ